MAVMISEDKKDLIVNCECGCENALHIRIDPEDDYYLHVLNSNFYRNQNMTVFKIICTKLKKIWSIIRSKDFYYSEICMTAKDYETFKKYINQFGGCKNENN